MVPFFLFLFKVRLIKLKGLHNSHSFHLSEHSFPVLVHFIFPNDFCVNFSCGFLKSVNITPGGNIEMVSSWSAIAYFTFRKCLILTM